LTAKFMERLQVTKEVAQKFDENRLNHKKLSALEVKKQYQIIISKRLAGLENLSDSEDTNRLVKKFKRTSKFQERSRCI